MLTSYVSNRVRRTQSFRGHTTALAGMLGLLLASNTTDAVPVMFSGNGHYYEVISNALPWQEASDTADATVFAGVTGHLATITSEAENTFITSLLPGLAGPVWIGGFQSPQAQEPAADWQWVTGEPFVYTNWGPGEPNNSNRLNLDEDALMIGWPVSSQQLWNDGVAAGGLVGHIIEYDVDLAGDLNADGFIGIEDLHLVLQAWNELVPVGDTMAGDPSGDGFVGIEDLNIVLGNWNAGLLPTSAAPEPASLAIWFLGGYVVMRVRPANCMCRPSASPPRPASTRARSEQACDSDSTP